MGSSRRRRRRLSDAEREQRREAHRRQLAEAVEALLTTEGWRSWVAARARDGLRRYSLNNQLLIALQHPEATYVCGFKALIELGYCVRKGERAIRILAPMKVTLADDDPAAAKDAGEDEHARCPSEAQATHTPSTRLRRVRSTSASRTRVCASAVTAVET